jgi:hypothetical protein
MLETKLSELTVNTQGDAMAKLLDGGFVDVMTGPKPADGDEKITTQRVLVTMTFGRPAFKATKSGVMNANPLTPGIGVAEGDPEWYRAYTPDRRPVMDGTAGKSNANMVLPVKTIVEGVTVGSLSFTHTVSKSLPGI